MTFDFCSLAIFRIVLGLLVLCQSVLLSRDFTAFYQADGVSPSHAWSESLLQALIFGVLPLFAVSLLIGFVTRLSTLLCLVGVVIIQDANPQILQGGDVLLRLLLFWSLFLPLDRIWSLDARWMKIKGLSLPWTTRLATWALTLQICFVYWFAALLKSDALWTQNGNALFYALNIEHFTTPFGLYLRQFPDLLRFITLGTPWFELIGPCLLFIPFHRDACRLAAVTLFMGFHLIGMEALSSNRSFPLGMCGGMACLHSRFLLGLVQSRTPWAIEDQSSKETRRSPKEEGFYCSDVAYFGRRVLLHRRRFFCGRTGLEYREHQRCNFHAMDEQTRHIWKYRAT